MIKNRLTIKKIFTSFWITAGTVFLFWIFYSYQSHGVDEKLLQNDSNLNVLITDNFYSFTPRTYTKNVLIFYPGAMVNPKAYVPLCRKIANNGVKVYLIKMPWRIAALGYNKPKEFGLFADKTKIYTLSGHSEGAKMAAQFVYENPTLVDKLILIGTTHPRDISLANNKIQVLKIYGSKDGVADEQSIMHNKPRLPAKANL